MNFPSALGKMSSTNKSYRLLKEVTWHSHLQHHSTHTTFRLEYLHCILNMLLKHFENEDDSGVVDLLSNLSLLKEDMDSLWSLGLGDLSTDAFKKFPTKLKSSVTRMLNSLNIPLPFDTNVIAKPTKKKAEPKEANQADYGEAEIEIIEEEEEVQDDDDKLLDKMKKKSRAKKASKGKTTKKKK
eukprot:NODE_432_length_7521_cov_0.745891.p5 type:complete len:184 gc:universal NODE_432_length_7521_cov_0.745891:775-224(-)